jgi:tRNA threonylcarbamoyladenosine biosynthesis protein TsaE
LPELAGQVLEFSGNLKVWLFLGDLGAGKTTFIQFICEALNVNDRVSSPTFSLVNEYLAEDGNSVYHMDFYRIKHEIEAVEVGLEEYFDSGNYCFIEWPEKIRNLWPQQYLQVELETISATERKIKVTKKL